MDPLLINRRIIYSPGDGRSTGGCRAGRVPLTGDPRRALSGRRGFGIGGTAAPRSAWSNYGASRRATSRASRPAERRHGQRSSVDIDSSSQPIIIIIIINNIIIISADIIGCSVHMRISAQNRWPCAVGLHDRLVCRFTIFQQAYSVFEYYLHRIMNLDIGTK